MVNPRWRCACCFLPSHAIEHVEEKAGGDHEARAARHNATADKIRSGRHSPGGEPLGVEPTQPWPRGGIRRSVYDAGGKETLPGKLVRAEGAAAARDVSVNEAYDNVGITLDFYAKVFGRDSLDGHGMAVNSSVHYGDRWPNAMWDGKEMLFGDGDGVHIGGFTKSLDIIAHELTHAVTQHTIGGLGVVMRKGKPNLAGEAGALNESISDVFASQARQWHAKQGVAKADWLLGVGILAPELGHAVRSLKDPGNRAKTYEGDEQVAHMSKYVKGGDVHVNSGIPNHAFYLCAAALGGHSWEHAGRIWYEALPLLKPKATFADAAQATGEAAARLYGRASKEQHAVQAAWQKVGVTGG